MGRLFQLYLIDELPTDFPVDFNGPPVCWRGSNLEQVTADERRRLSAVHGWQSQCVFRCERAGTFDGGPGGTVTVEQGGLVVWDEQEVVWVEESG
jgi:hypothetical protein